MKTFARGMHKDCKGCCCLIMCCIPLLPGHRVLVATQPSEAQLRGLGQLQGANCLQSQMHQCVPRGFQGGVTAECVGTNRWQVNGSCAPNAGEGHTISVTSRLSQLAPMFSDMSAQGAAECYSYA